jgi:hypothetical protein
MVTVRTVVELEEYVALLLMTMTCSWRGDLKYERKSRIPVGERQKICQRNDMLNETEMQWSASYTNG